MKSSVQVLTEARELLSDEKRWTKGEAARNVWGDVVSPHDEAAVCFCSLGALDKVTGRNSLDYLFAQRMLHKCIPEGVVNFNDNPLTEHSEIIAAFDQAIVLAKLEEYDEENI